MFFKLYLKALKGEISLTLKVTDTAPSKVKNV